MELEVHDAYPEDLLGIARLDAKSLKDLGAKEGDTIQIRGKKSTAARCLVLPKKEKKHMIRINQTIRQNAQVMLGDFVEVKKLDAPCADMIVLSPQDRPVDGRYIVDVLDLVPVSIDDCVVVPYFGENVAFFVEDVIPQKTAVVNKNTATQVIGQKQSDSFVYPTNRVELQIQSHAKTQGGKNFLVMLFSLTHYQNSIHGQFSAGLDSTPPKDLAEKYRGAAEDLINSANVDLLEMTKKMDAEDSAKMLEILKLAILEKWART